MWRSEVWRLGRLLAALGLLLTSSGCCGNRAAGIAREQGADPGVGQKCEASVLEFLERHAHLSAREFLRQGLTPPSVETLRRCVLVGRGDARRFAGDLLVSALHKELPPGAAREFAASKDGNLRLLAAQHTLIHERANSPVVGRVGWSLLAMERDPQTRLRLFSELLMRDSYRSQRTMLEELKDELLLSRERADKLSVEVILWKLRKLVPQGPPTEELSYEEATSWVSWLDTHAGGLAWDRSKRVFRLHE